MRVSAKNQLEGTIVAIEHGTINSQVDLEIAPGVVVTAVITRASVENLGLQRGKKAYAIIKSSSVMVGVE